VPAAAAASEARNTERLVGTVINPSSFFVAHFFVALAHTYNRRPLATRLYEYRPVARPAQFVIEAYHRSSRARNRR
jgi:hypothetical protein